MTLETHHCESTMWLLPPLSFFVWDIELTSQTSHRPTVVWDWERPLANVNSCCATLCEMHVLSSLRRIMDRLCVTQPLPISQSILTEILLTDEFLQEISERRHTAEITKATVYSEIIEGGWRGMHCERSNALLTEVNWMRSPATPLSLYTNYMTSTRLFRSDECRANSFIEFLPVFEKRVTKSLLPHATNIIEIPSKKISELTRPETTKATEQTHKQTVNLEERKNFRCIVSRNNALLIEVDWVRLRLVNVCDRFPNRLVNNVQCVPQMSAVHVVSLEFCGWTLGRNGLLSMAPWPRPHHIDIHWWFPLRPDGIKWVKPCFQHSNKD